MSDSRSSRSRVLALLPSIEPGFSVIDDDIDWRDCADLPTLVAQLAECGAEAIVLTDDVAAGDDLPQLIEALRFQPQWSDLPVLLLSHFDTEAPTTARAVALLGNVIVLERPVRKAVLMSALRTAIRARQRQYAMRDQLETMRQSEERFELATQATQDAIWDLHCLVDDAGKRVIKRVALVWGPGVDDAALDDWAERVHPEDRERVVASLHAALDGTGTHWSQEYRFSVDDRYMHVFDRGQIIRDLEQRAVRAVGAMMDVTVRRRAEEATALHAAIVASSDDAIVSKTLDGTIRSWNAGAERLFGYTASEAIGRHISMIVPPDKLEEEAGILARLRRGERIEHFETRRVAKNGQQFEISLSVSPLIDRHGRVLGASKVARDVTARKRAERDLRHRDAKLRLLWESAAVLLTTDRPDMMLRGVFDKIAAYFELDAFLSFMAEESGESLSLESFAGIDDEQVVALQRLTVGEHAIGAAAVQRTPIAHFHIQESDDPAVALERSLGFRACMTCALVVDGRLLGTLSFATRRKDRFATDELEFLQVVCHYVTAAYERVRLIRQLRDSDHRKDEFLATLAHELRNPLAPIRNALEIMRVNGRERSAVEVAARTMIERQLEQMVRLVDDLLDVSRITRGRLELRTERVTLAAVVKSAVDTSRPLIEGARHELTVSLPPQPIYLDADPVRLAQVFSNLLNNAARYMDHGGRIWITAVHGAGEVVVTVRDTGMGIPAEDLPRIFDMFAQVSTSNERAQSGLGIGLTLVRRLLALHGGKVEARSEGEGHGAELVVTLPIAAVQIASPAPVGGSFASAHATPHRILVADDNRDAAESMGMLLRLMGNEVRTVYDGVDAVEEAEEFRPDVILLDIGMPRLNGYDAARMIRGRQWSGGTMLVALTGWGQEEDKRKASEAGFDRHFTKPLDPAVLQRLITDFKPEPGFA